MSALHDKALARMLMLAQGCESFRLLLSRGEKVGRGSDLIDHVAGGRPIKPGRWSGRAALAVLPSWSVRAGSLERSRLCTACRMGGAAVVEC